ncbi:MAG TPA: acyl-CoA dehydrogenase family protein [Pseudonocardia sp.]|jgi:alkylation response protein AidB-like acyl-CoA dehydrogenase
MTSGINPGSDRVEAALDRLLARPMDDPGEFLGAQFDLGLAWVHFAAGHGGLGCPKDRQREVDQRLRDAGAPETPANFVGRHQVASTVQAIGSPAHKQRFLRRIFTGEDRWCQLFSEPGAGSDLANVGALAVRDGDRWTISGQKVWTSGARTANLALLLARTDPEQPKHRGLTMFVLDMHSPGIEVRPLRQADGGARFSEVFLTDVELDDELRIGAPGDGWKVALAVLGTERDGASDLFHRPVDELLARWRERRAELPAAMRDDVVRLWIESRVIELGKQRRRAAPDHPDAARLAAISKICTSEHAQRLAELTARVIGPAALVGAEYAAALEHDLESEAAPPADHFAVMPVRLFLLRSRAMSIEGGTNEISRNQIGERILGLPPDVRVDKGRPWREVPR